MKKSIITFIVFTLTIFAFSCEIKAFAKALMIEQPAADSCYEIVLEDGLRIYANVIAVDTAFVKYRYCGEISTTPIHTISKKQIVAIKEITETEGKKKHYIATRTSKGNKQIKKIYFLYFLSLLPYFLLKYLELSINGLWVYVFPITAILISIWTLIEIRKIKHDFKLKSLLKMLSLIQIIVPLIFIIVIKILFSV
jgi:hypothetical protein